MKVVTKKSLNKASTENLLTEIEILKSVRHPHIVQLKDFQVGAQQLPGAPPPLAPPPLTCGQSGRRSDLGEALDVGLFSS